MKHAKFIYTLLVSLIFCAAFAAEPAVSGPAKNREPLRTAGMAEKLGYQEGDTAVTIPAWVRELPPYCFAGCNGLRRVDFADGSQLGKISDFAFAECQDLEEFEMPEGVQFIGEGAFRGCRNLRTIALPERLWVISRECFAYCHSLNGITLPKGLREIKPLAFLDCRKLELTEIPSRVTKIGNNAFGRCFSLREMHLPAGCKSLDSYAFADCISLESIVLPSNESQLGELLFSGCTKLRLIKEGSLVPPVIECASSLFEPSDKEAWKNCVVIVPHGRLWAYKDSPFWNVFKKLTDEKE